MAHDRLIPTVPMPVLPSAPSSMPESQYATRDYVMEWYRRLSDRVDGIVAGSSTPATRETLGGVIIGDGVDVDAEGRISVSRFTPTDEQQKVLTSGITSEKVSTYDGYAKSKQDTLNISQLNAVNSGITAEKVGQYDGTLDDRRVVITGLDGRFYTMTVLADGRLQLSETDDPGVGGWMPPVVSLPYDFADATLSDGTVTFQPRTVAQLVSDGAAFTVAVAEGEEGKARDCQFTFDCTSLTTAPTITWPANFHPRTDAETDFACVAGVRNVYWITEYAEGQFAVAGWQETTGGNAS